MAINLEIKRKEKTELSKQQIVEIQKIFVNSILPKKNHTLFEVNLKSLDIKKAVFDDLPPISWEKAIKGDLSLKRKVTKNEHCIYISALNEQNVVKILYRDYKIIL